MHDSTSLCTAVNFEIGSRFAAIIALAHIGAKRFQYELALGFYYGRGVARNPAKAFLWCKRAANNNFPPAEYLLATFYAASFGISAADRHQAFIWSQRAAEHDDPCGKHMLAWCYEQGIGVEPSPELAFGWYLEAAKNGVPNAQWAVAAYLYEGIGIAKDIPMAMDWCKLAIRNGADAPAQELLTKIEAEIT